MNTSISSAMKTAYRLLRDGRQLEAQAVIKETLAFSATQASTERLARFLELTTSSRPQTKQHESHIMRVPLLPKTQEQYSRFSIALCIITTAAEKEVTNLTVSYLLQQLKPTDRIFVMCNGFSDPCFASHLEKHSRVTCVTSLAHLGVAGGRNYLYKAVFTTGLSFTHIATLDNDVILPLDFLSHLHAVLSRYDHDRIGVLGGVILDYKASSLPHFLTSNYISFASYFGAQCFNFLTSDLAFYINSNPQHLSKILWHIGIDQDYEAAYVRRDDLIASSDISDAPFTPMLVYSSRAASLLAGPHFSVSNIPGCFQCISVARFNELGFLNEHFSPYFFEDSEFCIRALKAGYTNLISTSLILAHGTDHRHKSRRNGRQKIQHIINEYRARYVLLRTLGLSSPNEHLLPQINKVFCEQDHVEAGLIGIEAGASQFKDSGAERDWRAVNASRTKTPQQLLLRISHSEQNAPQVGEGLPPLDSKLPTNYFTTLKAFRNAYKGKDCLLICNGPSLQNTRLGLFAGVSSFAVNSIFPLQQNLDFKPNFYTVEDNHVVADNLLAIQNLNSAYSFFPDKYRPQLGDRENRYYLPANWDCYFSSRSSYEYPEFSEDIARCIFTGQTVTYLNLQLALYFGFQRVFIVGLDFSYSIPKQSVVSGNSIDHGDDDANHFHKSYFGKGKQWHFPKLDSCLTSYSIAREAFEARGRQIFDLTLDGKLNVFDTITWNEALGFPPFPPSLAPALSLKQYILDTAFALSAVAEVPFSCGAAEPFTDEQSGVYVKFHTSLKELSSEIQRIWASSSPCAGHVAVYPNELLSVHSTETSIIQSLPFFKWAQCSLLARHCPANRSETFPSDIPWFLSTHATTKDAASHLSAEALRKKQYLYLSQVGAFWLP
jgi:GT2 family glycosyltransferase